MQNSMYELSELIDKLNYLFEKKKHNIDNNKKGESAKIEARIKALEVYQIEIEGLYSTNENMLVNFRKRVNEIQTEIESF